jgi:hypothetical protein
LSGTLPQIEISLDYRADRTRAGLNLAQPLMNCLADQSAFLPTDWLQQRLLTWSRQQRVQLYQLKDGKDQRLNLQDILPAVGRVFYDHELGDRSWTVIERLLDEVQRDVLEKIFHKVRYDIDKRRYRYETVQQSVAGAPGDFIDRYSVTFEFARESEKQAFEKDAGLQEQLEFQLKEEQGRFHIYEPLLGEPTETLLQQYKLQRIGISPDKLNAGERKFLQDILTFIDTNYSRDHREFYLMRNVESLRSIGLYLEGETRVFYPDFVLWIVDEKAKKTTLALFDPKGQTGIIKSDDLGLNGPDGMNDKVRIANSTQLTELAQKLQEKTGRNWSVHSFILLRDSSPLGRFKGATATDPEMELAEAMIQKGVLRLNWHERDEEGQVSVQLRDGRSYLSRIFEKIF